MSTRTVQFTPAAIGQATREQLWWITHRDDPDRFRQELAGAIDRLAEMPGVGAPYPSRAGVRRIYLPRVDLHVYYTFTDDIVLIRAVRGARRGRGPRL